MTTQTGGSHEPTSAGPLAGIKVLALENYLAGNHGSFLMSMFGAEIWKIEQPGVGDALREVGPFLQNDGRSRAVGELGVMGNKKSIALDLRDPAGLAIFFDLVEQADIVWSNQKPASLTKLGITADTLAARNSDIIFSTVSGFGHSDLLPSGPYGDLTAFDLIAQGLAGLQFRTPDDGEDSPGYNGLPLGDEITSTLAVLGTVLALLNRQREQKAQRVDVAMYDAMMFVNRQPLVALSTVGLESPRGRSGASTPYRAFRARDGWVNIAVGGDIVWRRLCEAMDSPALARDDRFARAHDRLASKEEVERITGEWVAGLSVADVLERLGRHTVPAAPVLTLADVLASDQATARDMLVTMEDPVAGSVRIVGNPIKMSVALPAAVTAPPEMGEHTREVLMGALGLSSESLDRLEATGAIGRAARTSTEAGANQ